MASESAWLLERNNLCVGICNGRLRWVCFTDPKAVRFQTEEKAIEYAKQEKIIADAREHEWTDVGEWTDGNLGIKNAECLCMNGVRGKFCFDYHPNAERAAEDKK